MPFLKSFFLSFCLILSTSVLLAQTAKIKGKVTEKGGEPLYLASVGITSIKKGVVTDINGAFSLSDLPLGKYQLTVSCMGFKTQKLAIVVSEGKEYKLNVMLQDQQKEIAEVEVTGKTELRKIQESPMTVTAIDVKSIQGRATSVQELLNRAPGVKVQQDGGLGSFLDISINGLSGKSVKIFIDGIPIEYQGLGLAQNLPNLSINLIDRIEIYKGVIPISMGADVLGGAINIVTTNRYGTFVDASAERSSFNTWRSSLNMRYVHAKTGLYAALYGNQAYSDNNFFVSVEVPNENGNPDTVKLRQFHNRYRTYTATAEVGVKGKKWADRLILSQTISRADLQLQHPNRDMNKAFGKAFVAEEGYKTELKYAKERLLDLPLDANAYIGLNMYNTYFVDTSTVQYNWFGNPTGNALNSGELGISKFNALITTQSVLSRANVAYHLTDNHTFSINSVFTSAYRTGKDTLSKHTFGQDPFENPQKLQKLVAGAAYESNFFHKRLTNVIAAKYYQLKGNINNALFFTPAPKDIGSRYSGWHDAIVFDLVPKKLLVRASYERSARMPNENELFGDGVFIYANPDLVPEKAYNFNAGFAFDLDKKIKVHLEGGYFYRSVEDMIFLVTSPFFNQYKNIAKVRVEGVEGQIKLKPLSWLQADFAISYQDIRNRTDTTGPQSGFLDKRYYNSRLPNTPIFTYNSDIFIIKYNAIKDGDRADIFWQCKYDEAYYLFFEADGAKDTKLRVPTQFVQNIGTSYTLPESKASISFEVDNIADIKVIDKFGLQRPGRSYFVKLRWFMPINKK